MQLSRSIALLSLVMVGACAQDIEVGNAVTHNIAAQAVDMNPQYAGVAVEGGSGERSVLAQRRYLKGEVKQPAVTGSKNTNSGGGTQ